MGAWVALVKEISLLDFHRYRVRLGVVDVVSIPVVFEIPWLDAQCLSKRTF